MIIAFFLEFSYIHYAIIRREDSISYCIYIDGGYQFVVIIKNY